MGDEIGEEIVDQVNKGRHQGSRMTHHMCDSHCNLQSLAIFDALDINGDGELTNLELTTRLSDFGERRTWKMKLYEASCTYFNSEPPLFRMKASRMRT